MKYYAIQNAKKMSFIAGILFLSFVAVAKTHSVTMKSISYDPKELSIKVGDSVEWNNKSYTEHSATSEDEKANLKFDTGLIQPKKTSKKVEFKNPGTYSYHCSVHGKTMSGKIDVTQ